MTQHTHDPSHVPDLLLERYRLGEMSPAEIEGLRRCLATDEKLRARLRALDDSDAEIGRSYPSGWLAARIRQRLRADVSHPCRTVSRLSFGWRLPIAVAAVAAVVLGVGLRFLGPLQPLPAWMTSHSGEQVDRLKGRSLVLFRKTAAGSEVLGDEARVRAGDQIRIGYRAAVRSYGLILSIDGRGVVTRHFPQRGEQAALLTHDGLVLLDHAFELDDAPGWERFYLVTGHEVFKVAPVLEAARRLGAGAGSRPSGPLILSAPLEQTSLILSKEATQ